MTQIMVSTAVFKLVNMVGLLGYLLTTIDKFSDWSSDAADVVNGVFHLIMWIALLVIEVDQKPAFSKYVPFLYSFVGRGVFYVWLAWISFRISLLSIIGAVITCIVGIIYVLLFVLKNLQAPSTMTFEENYAQSPEDYLSESASFLPTHNNSLGATAAPDEENSYTAI
ncbi:COPI associated protein-domain-containing protein [Mucor mucedo]|uniref:COPI associated protein-domain-containing protein n=1 Tax=Mucor mucedo TaxID=29922 RepID=UPI00221F08D0|nr:COPI associated protein-domain-containing protein [Mucor mucedo]KAI7889553.1 COPI associated protein-domain-containing protein [Mucor mucedo]